MRSGTRSRGAEWIKLPRTDRPMATPAGGHAERPEAPAQLHGRTATLAREELQGVVVLQPLGEELRAMRAQGAEHAGRDGHTGKRAGEPERPVTRCRRVAVARQRHERFPGKVCTARQNRYVAKRRSEEHTSELQSQSNLVCRLLLENKTTLMQL